MRKIVSTAVATHKLRTVQNSDVHFFGSLKYLPVWLKRNPDGPGLNVLQHSSAFARSVSAVM